MTSGITLCSRLPGVPFFKPFLTITVSSRRMRGPGTNLQKSETAPDCLAIVVRYDFSKVLECVWELRGGF